MSFVVMLTPNMFEILDSRSQLRFQTFTEMVFISTSYMFLIFSMVKVEDNFTVGYVPIIIFGFYIALVLLIVLKGIVTQSRKSLTKFCLKRSYRKQRASLQAQLAANHEKRKVWIDKLWRRENLHELVNDNQVPYALNHEPRMEPVSLFTIQVESSPCFAREDDREDPLAT